MKKILLLLPVLALLAATCDKPSGQQNQLATPGQNEQVGTSTSTNSVQTPQSNVPINTKSDSNQTENWKLYTSSTYGFQFKYPGDWIVSTNGSSVIVKQKNNSKSTLIVEPVNVGRQSVFDTASGAKLQEVTFAGKKSKEYTCPKQNNCPSQLSSSRAVRITQLPSGWGATNEIIYENYGSEANNQGIFEQILETFAFTTVNMKTYTSTQYAFQISYPSENYQIKAEGSNFRIYKNTDLQLPEYYPVVSINIFSNTNNLSAEEYLQAFYTRWLGEPSQYTDFKINETTTFNGMAAIKFGTDRDTYYLIKHGSNMYVINTLNTQISSTFKFTR